MWSGHRVRTLFALPVLQVRVINLSLWSHTMNTTTTPYSVTDRGTELAAESAPEKMLAPRRLTLEDIPDKTLRFFLRWDVSNSKFNMGCHLVLTKSWIACRRCSCSSVPSQTR